MAPKTNRNNGNNGNNNNGNNGSNRRDNNNTNRSTTGTTGSSTWRPSNIETHIPAYIRRELREGTHYLYLQGQLIEIKAGVAADDVEFVDDGDVVVDVGDTPGTSAADRLKINNVAAKAWHRNGKENAWRTLLRPLTANNPLPVEIATYLTRHFAPNEQDKPSEFEKFHGITITDYASHRDRTSCFVCAALCDQILRDKSPAIQARRVLRSHSQNSLTRHIPIMTADVQTFVQQTPNLLDLLKSIDTACRLRDAGSLTELLVLPLRLSQGGEGWDKFLAMRTELQQTCPDGNEEVLIATLKNLATSGWVSILPMVLTHLRCIRDCVWNNDYEKKELQKYLEDATVALGDATYGSLILPTVLDLSRRLALVVCKFSPSAATLAQATSNSGHDQSSTRQSKFLEECANSLREAFIRCLVGGSSGSAAHSNPPDGKRQGIYITANSCLRVLFQCGKLRNAQQMFVSIDAQSPYLDFYPRAQRVTYLYYLGAYHFANNHFYRSQLTLQAAYNLSHRQDLPHRAQILTYLIAANICLGRFPSQTLLSRPEATDLAPHFYPLCHIIAQGDLGTFHKHLDLRSESSRWFLRKRILLQLRNRGEVLVWRSLIRKTFRYAGHQPAGDRMVPFLRLPFVQAAAQFSLQRARAPSNRTLTKQGTFSFVTQQPTPPAEDDYTDPDLDGVDAAINETGFDVETGSYDDTQIGQLQHSLLTPSTAEPTPSIAEVESIFASLIHQGFLRGFLTHGEKPRFAVPGSNPNGGPLVHGFPNIWRVVEGREEEGVPGWVRREDNPPAGPFAGQGGSGAGGGGRVVNLSGARPAGAGP